MADTARDPLTAINPTLKREGLNSTVVRYWGVNLLMVILLLVLVAGMLVYQNANVETPALVDSTVGQLGIWIAEQSALDAPVSLLGQIAKNQAAAAGQTSLDQTTVMNAMRIGLVIFNGALVVFGLIGLAGLLRSAKWARVSLLVVLIGLDIMMFIAPSLKDDNPQVVIVTALVLLLAILIFAPGKTSKMLGFVMAISALLVIWEGVKGFGAVNEYRVTAGETGWNSTVYANLDETLTGLQNGEVSAAILDKNDVETLIPPYPEEGADPSSFQYPNLRILTNIDTGATGFANLPIIPAFPGRLAVIVRDSDVNNWTRATDLLGVQVGTFTESFSNEKFLAMPRKLVLLDLRITNDANLPHLQSIAQALFQPARRNGELLLVRILGANGLFTWAEAGLGFLSGAFLGFVLGALFAHSKLLERGLLPYVVASQTIPILAIAPMVVIWLGSGSTAVAVIAAYLTFFPVTINTLRGLTSPQPTAIELMRSYAASWWSVLWKLRFPAALPYIFTALKVSATASVVGAIIGELPSGVSDGLGRAILNFNQYYSSDPAKLWAAILIAALVGIAFFLLVSFIERIVLGRRVQAV